MAGLLGEAGMRAAGCCCWKGCSCEGDMGAGGPGMPHIIPEGAPLAMAADGGEVYAGGWVNNGGETGIGPKAGG